MTPIFRDLWTERLLLRSICAADREFMFRQFSDADVTRWLFDEEPYTRIEEADALIAFYTAPEPRSQHRWMLVPRLGGDIVGTCGFHCINYETRSAEIGYDLAPEYRNMGYMTEALRAALAFAQNELHLLRIDAHIYPENAPSVHIAEKLGFVYSGENTEYVFRGKSYPHRIYTLHLEDKP